MVYKEPRPRVVPGTTERVRLVCGNLYVTVTNKDGKIFEVFATLGKSGGCSNSNMAALTLSITMGLRYGVPVDVYIEKLKDVHCGAISWEDGIKYTSCADAISKVMEKARTELSNATGL